MLKRLVLCFLPLLNALSVAAAVPPPEYPADSRNIVYYLPQFSEFQSISELEMLFFKKTVERAAEARAKALILELDTPGGNVETAFKYLSLMARSRVPIIVYLNPNGISAGMIIALGADRIAISRQGLIGDAMPLAVTPGGARPVTDKPDKPEPSENAPAEQSKNDDAAQRGENDRPALERLLEEVRAMRRSSSRGPKSPLTPEEREIQKLADQKFLTVFFKMLQVLAEKNRRPVRVVRAMADPYTVLTVERDGFAHNKVSPLTLSAEEARRLGVVDYIVTDRADLLKQLHLDHAEIVEVRRTPTEQVGAFLAHPVLAGLLLMLGLVGLFIEFKTPGFGVPGILGVAALTLFFLGHIASGASDWGPMVVFFVGLVLLALEIFVIPGFGLVGALGIGCMLISFFWSFGFNRIETALHVVTVALLAAIAIMVVLALYVLPRTPLFRKVMLEKSFDRSDGFTAVTEAKELVGKRGVTLTPLRPAGAVEIDGKRHDGASESVFLDAGVKVEVTACNGFQLIVRPLSGNVPEDPGQNQQG